MEQKRIAPQKGIIAFRSTNENVMQSCADQKLFQGVGSFFSHQLIFKGRGGPIPS